MSVSARTAPIRSSRPSPRSLPQPPEVDAGEHGLAHARRRGAVDLVNHLRDGAAAFLAPRQGDDAEGAAVAAAVLDLDEGALAAAGEEGIGLGRHGGEGHGGQIEFGGGDRHQAVLVRVGDHQVNAGLQRQGLGLQGGQAAADDQLGAGVIALGAAQELAGLADRLLGDGAGVDHDQVGPRLVGGDLVAELLELACPGLQFRFVEPTAEGLEVDAHQPEGPGTLSGDMPGTGLGSGGDGEFWCRIMRQPSAPRR